ncbi:ABC_transp_aux domain-containing protein [Azospirillaceae bacterium]
MDRRLMSIAGLITSAILFIAINIVSNAGLRQARLDLTADQLFTLSPGTRNILATIKEPIMLRFFFSERLSADVPNIRTYGQRVRELLEEYVHRSGGMIRMQVIDPEPFSDSEDRAVQAGLQSAPVDQGSQQQFYFGLVGTNSTDRKEVISFFQQERENFLEYDLTKLIYNLTDPKKSVVAVLGDAPMEFGPGGAMAAMRNQGQSYALLEQMRQTYTVRMLKNDVASIDDDVNVLLIARPRTLTPTTLYAIDQYVLRGGRAMIFVDPWAESESDQPGPYGMSDPSSSHAATLSKLFEAWGVDMEDGKFVADPKLALRVATGEGARRRTVPYAAWLSLPIDSMNRKDPILADLNTINLASAGSLKPRSGATTHFEPLLTSSTQGQLADISYLRFRPDPEGLLTSLQPNGQRLTLAARVSGAAKTAFPEGPPAVENKEKNKDQAENQSPEIKTTENKTEEKKPEVVVPTKPRLETSVSPINVILVADSDFLEDRFWVQSQSFFGQKVMIPMAGNGDFVINGIDHLAGSSDLIGLRGRAGATRPFIVVEELRRFAGRQFLAREQELRRNLEQTEKQITELQSKSKPGAGSSLLSVDEHAAIDNFRQEVLRIRKELRDVQRNLNRDIDALATKIKAVNIGLMPVIVAFFAIIMAGARGRKRRLQTTQG